MSGKGHRQRQTFEQLALTWDGLAEWSSGFANGVVRAFEESGASAPERLAAVRQPFQTAISAAIVRRDAAIAHADVVAEGVWRSVADEMSRAALLLADDSREAAMRLAALTVALGETGSMADGVGTKHLTPCTSRALCDWMCTYLPDGFWRTLASFTLDEGAVRQDPAGSVYVSMLLHRIDNSIQLSDLVRLFDLASAAREGREAVALLNELSRMFLPDRPSLADDVTDEQLIAYAGRIAAVTDTFAGRLRIKAALSTASDAHLDFGAFLSLQNLSPLVVSGADPQAQASLDKFWQNTHGDVYLAWASDR